MKFDSALVTGASGFIGRALVRQLSNNGVRVTALARPSSRLPENLEVLRTESYDRETLAKAFAGRKFDVVFHLGAYGVVPTDRDPGTMFSTNVAGTSALIDVSAATGCRGFVFAGTCSEYATPQSPEPLDEDSPLTGSHLYGSSKAAGGLWGQALSSSLGMPFQWMRLFGVYGAGEAAYRLLPHLTAKLYRGETVPLTPGVQVRDFLYVDDVATGLQLAAEAALEGRTGPFNLCSGRGVTVKWVAEHIAGLLGKPASLLDFGAMPYRPGEPLWLVGRPDRFASAAGFRPSVSLEEGLARVVKEISGSLSP